MHIEVTESIKKLKPYEPGKPIDEVSREYGITDIIKLASNENALGASPKAVEAISSYLKEVFLYPDGGAYHLRTKLAQKHYVELKNILIGNGTNEIIDILIRALVRPDEEVLLSKYSFIMYKIGAMAHDRRIVEVPMKDWRFDVEALAHAVTDKTKIVFIANPNNPTGTYITKDEFEWFLENTPEHLIIVMDEAYFEYVDQNDYPDSSTYISKDPRIVTLRTFSKIYGLAGLRVGYAVAHEDIVNYCNRVRNPFNCNSLAQIAAIAAMDDKEHVKRSKELADRGREFLTEKMSELAIWHIAGNTNFILIDVKRPSGEVFQEMLKRGVIIRPLVPYEMPTHFRVTIGLPEENNRFVNSLSEVLGIKN